VLPSRNRLRRSADFARVVRSARRGSSGTVVVHWLSENTANDPRIGFVVGKGVGGAVVRKRVTRRLRALMFARISELPPGTSIVVRALPAASAATFAMLGKDLDHALGRATGSGQPHRAGGATSRAAFAQVSR
jgi:ribonuclease P protein component